jgi:hypothetical protein
VFRARVFFQFWKTVPHKFLDACTGILLDHRMQNLVDNNEAATELEKRMCKSVYDTVDLAVSVRLQSCFINSPPSFYQYLLITPGVPAKGGQTGGFSQRLGARLIRIFPFRVLLTPSLHWTG